MCDIELNIKIGCQVMSIINVKTDEGHLEICNGSQGIVTAFCPISGYPIVKYNNGTISTMCKHTWTSQKIPGIGVSQIPLILAWAVTIHKSQGATLDAAEIDVGSGIFERGQTYVALSRVKSLEGLYLKSFDIKKIIISKKVQNYYNELSLTDEEYEELQKMRLNTLTEKKNETKIESKLTKKIEEKKEIIQKETNQDKKLIQSQISSWLKKKD